MSKPLMRIPYTGALPPPIIIPQDASTLEGAINCLCYFLAATKKRYWREDGGPFKEKDGIVFLTGAGMSVASGLADYRGKAGTYTQNKSYRPIYFHEFVGSHEARKRYWARSFLGWRGLHRSQPNAAHYAVRDFAQNGYARSVITQNVDSFHSMAHPNLSTVELHGYLRSLVCLSCNNLMPRAEFQEWLARLNPAWSVFLQELLKSGALDTENPEERRQKGYRTNPDGDADVPGAPYTTFRYPACPTCLAKGPPPRLDGTKRNPVVIDKEGAWSPESSDSGVLKPNVIMFGESIPDTIKEAAEKAIDEAERILIVGSSLATYSAWRLVKKAQDQKMPIGILNIGGVRKEEAFFPNYTRDGEEIFDEDENGDDDVEEVTDENLFKPRKEPAREYILEEKRAFRASLPAEIVLPRVCEILGVRNHIKVPRPTLPRVERENLERQENKEDEGKGFQSRRQPTKKGSRYVKAMRRMNKQKDESNSK